MMIIQEHPLKPLLHIVSFLLKVVWYSIRDAGERGYSFLFDLFAVHRACEEGISLNELPLRACINRLCWHLKE